MSPITYNPSDPSALFPDTPRPQTPHRYFAFGRTIVSDIAMSELCEASAQNSTAAHGTVHHTAHHTGELHIELADLGVDLPPMGDAPSSMLFMEDQGVTMIWPGIAAVVIDPSNLRIRVQPFPCVPERYLAFPLLGPVLGWVLHAGGALVLHASAVEIDGLSLAFVGDKGAGKSTTASAFLAAGAQLLTDDLLVIDPVDPTPKIQPGFAQVKLNTHSADVNAVSGAEALPLVFEGFPKRQYRLPSLSPHARTCDAVFMLERSGSHPTVTWSQPTPALLTIMRYTYAARFQNVPAAMWHPHRHLELSSQLSRTTAIGKLAVPHDLLRLPELVDVVTDAVSERQRRRRGASSDAGREP